MPGTGGAWSGVVPAWSGGVCSWGVPGFGVGAWSHRVVPGPRGCLVPGVPAPGARGGWYPRCKNITFATSLQTVIKDYSSLQPLV